MAADWITTDSIALVREMAIANESNATIAMAVSKKLGQFVNPNMIAGRIARMKDLPPRSRLPKKPATRDPFDWVPLPKPAWGTAAADAIVAEAKARFITTYKIMHYFGVSDSSVVLAVRRWNGLPKPEEVSDQMRPFLPFRSEEWPLDRLTKLVNGWLAGHPYSELMVACHSTHSSAQKKVERLCKAGLLKARPTIAGNQPKKIAKPPTPKRSSGPQVHRPLGSANGGRTVHFLSTLVNWGAISRIKIEHAPGVCQWPLSCEAPSTGKWCDHHAGLLGRRAA